MLLCPSVFVRFLWLSFLSCLNLPPKSNLNEGEVQYEITDNSRQYIDVTFMLSKQ